VSVCVSVCVLCGYCVCVYTHTPRMTARQRDREREAEREGEGETLMMMEAAALVFLAGLCNLRSFPTLPSTVATTATVESGRMRASMSGAVRLRFTAACASAVAWCLREWGARQTAGKVLARAAPTACHAAFMPSGIWRHCRYFSSAA